MKPIIKINTTNNSNNYNELCLLCGQMSTNNNDDFSEDGWKRYYPSDECFFLYLKGDIIPEQEKIKKY